MFLRRPSLSLLTIVLLSFRTFHHHKPHHSPAPAWTLSFEQHQIFYTRVRIRKCTYMPCKYFIDRHDKPVFNVIGACFKKPKYLFYLLSMQCLTHLFRESDFCTNQSMVLLWCCYWTRPIQRRGMCTKRESIQSIKIDLFLTPRGSFFEAVGSRSREADWHIGLYGIS